MCEKSHWIASEFIQIESKRIQIMGAQEADFIANSTAERRLTIAKL